MNQKRYKKRLFVHLFVCELLSLARYFGARLSSRSRYSCAREYLVWRLFPSSWHCWHGSADKDDHHHPDQWSSPSPLCHHHHHCNHHNRLWQVSWIRRRENEMSLLTTDRLVFSADNRYSVVQVLLVSLLLVVLLVLMLVLVLLLTTDQLVFSADKRYSVVQVPNNRPSVAKIE